MIRFGAMSITLLIGALEGVAVAVALALRRENRCANRLLAALLCAYVARLVPYCIGYAGFYDAYPWLSFAPFDITLAYGPLIYLYVERLTTPYLPHRWTLHFIPALTQFTYLAIMFVQPLAVKNAWDARIEEPFVSPAFTVLTYLSLIVYVTMAARRYARYRAWLRDATSDPDAHRLDWLRNFLIAFAVTTLLDALWDLTSVSIVKLNYFNYFPLYVWYAILVYYLGLEGWRNASRAYPQPVPEEPRTLETSPALRAEALEWRSTMIAKGYARDPELTLAGLASELGMSPARLRRIVNDGLGQHFSEAINRLRTAEVCERLADSGERRDVLELAFEAGFSSKATFNRCFKAYAGVTPSEYRRTAGAARLTT